MNYRKTKNGIIVNMPTNGTEYQENAKEYVVNMHKNKKMLHIKNKCYPSRFLYEYISFETREEAHQLPFSVAECELCFTTQKSTSRRN